MSDVPAARPAEQLTLLSGECPAWNTSEEAAYRNEYRIDTPELIAAESFKEEQRRREVRWSLGALGFIGATVTGVVITEALRYLWQLASIN